MSKVAIVVELSFVVRVATAVELERSVTKLVAD